ncbi:MAG: hypothetical protein JSW27_15390 [Phycisphaerales bacterium]|nr:MAG: hypothetical protein JSW27_15390 [Phycisphaerales bacterium]
MNWNLIFDPPVSGAVLLGLALFGTLVVIAGYSRGARPVRGGVRFTLMVLRIGVLGALIFILMRPMVLVTREETRNKPVFSILIDTSESMNTKDVGKQSRFEAVTSALWRNTSASFLRKLARDYEIQVYGFDTELRRTSPRFLVTGERATGKATHIASALLDAVQGDPSHRTRGVLLLSDGRSSEIDALSGVRHAARYLRTLQVPVWTVPVGTATEVKDLRVFARLNSSFFLADQPGSLHVSVTGAGYKDWAADVHLYREDEYVVSKQVTLNDGHAEISFPVREEHRGVFRYRVEVEPLPGENDSDNNKRSVIARVVDEKTRVLVVEARPHWDSKFLLRALRADRNVEITSIFHINEKKSFAVVERLSGDGASDRTTMPGVRLPRTRDGLLRYDCIFLGRHMDDVFSSAELKLLQRYVAEDGGSLVFFRGKPYSQVTSELSKIEPVTWGGGILKDVRLELTPQGEASPLFDYGSRIGSGAAVVRELPSMTSVTRVTDEKSLAIVLARVADGRRGEPMATVVYHRYGAGKVMSIGASGLWQWGFLPERLEHYDEIYGRFWSQMIRWLISGSDFLPGRDISFQIDKSIYAPGEPVRMLIRAKLIDHTRYRPQIELTYPDGHREQLVPERRASDENLYEVSFTPQREGEYEAVLHNNTGKPEKDVVRFIVYDDSTESRYVQADREMLALLSQTTGGESLELGQLETLPERVEVFEKLAQECVKPEDVWDRSWVYAALISALGIEWLLRRIAGLL